MNRPADDPCRDCENHGRPLDRFQCLGCIAGVRIPQPAPRHGVPVKSCGDTVAK